MMTQNIPSVRMHSSHQWEQPPSKCSIGIEVIARDASLRSNLGQIEAKGVVRQN